MFTQSEEARIVGAIQEAERGTSGEIRLYVEDFCLRDHPVERAEEVFHLFGMHNTQNHNAVLLYIAPKSRHFAIWGDIGIHQKVGFGFWEAEKQLLREHFRRDEAGEGVVQCIQLIGHQLQTHFPSDTLDGHNELPDDIIYG